MDAGWGSKGGFPRASYTRCARPIRRARDARSRRASVKIVGLLALLFGASCRTEAATEVLVAVMSDLQSGSDLTELQVRVLDQDGKVELSRKKLLLSEDGATGTYVLPLSYSLTPAPNARSNFRLVVTGRGPGNDGTIGDRVEAQASAAFQSGRRMLLPILLARKCLEELCREDAQVTDQTCMDGACVDVPRVRLTPAGNGDGLVPIAKSDAGQPARESDGGGGDCESDENCQSPLDGASPAGCASAKCKAGQCVFSAADVDGDGHRTAVCTLPGHSISLGDDCDDRDPTVYPNGWDGPQIAGVEGRDQDRCDQRDNNCNGQVDEDTYEGKSCTCDPSAVDMDCSLRSDGSTITWPAGTPVGRCQYGKRSCTNGAWSPCVGAVEPLAQDTCQPDDDSNCNGQRNEGCPCVAGTQRACGAAVGSCTAGTQTCDAAGAWSADCIGAVAPKAADTCEPNNDDNCNGKVNDGCQCVNGTTSSCGAVANAKGDCASITITCTNGAWPVTGCTTTNPELCNDDNHDENCNGAVNERPPCTCVNGAISSCQLELKLKGNCEQLGFALCAQGAWTCTVQPQANDSCTQGSDDNCNGVPNEGCACVQGAKQLCPTSVPAGCTAGTQTCNRRGVWGTCMGFTCAADGGISGSDGG